MSNLLIDTTVVVDYLRGLKDAVDYLDQLKAAAVPTTHTVVVAEVVTGARDLNNLRSIEGFFAPFQIHRPDESDADLSIDLLKAFRLSHGVGWPDCLIAATALRLSLAVVTTNVKHFAAITALRVVRPY
jgi:predicted nucleic acid-binding protein